MGTVFTLDHPTQVCKLIPLAPALMLDPIASHADPKPVSVPTVVIHGTLDTVFPWNLCARWYKNCLQTLSIMWWQMIIVCINQFMNWIGIRFWNKTTQFACGG